MSWWGKVIGGAFGFMLGGPLGAILGAALGNQFDKGLKLTGEQGFAPGEQQRVQAAFFTATFSVMGHIAKADGHVTQDEIDKATSIMNQLELDADMRRAAIEIFNQGKSSDFDLLEVLEQFRVECHRRSSLVLMFLEIQVHAAYADGRLDDAEQKILHTICDHLRIPLNELNRIEQLVNGSHSFHQSNSKASIADAYQVLGVNKEANDAEVKRAYRRLMSQHHPDKMVAKGLPDEMITLAKEKSQDIQKAYEQVKKSRGMR